MKAIVSYRLDQSNSNRERQKSTRFIITSLRFRCYRKRRLRRKIPSLRDARAGQTTRARDTRLTSQGDGKNRVITREDAE